jgi:hypothetical protein
MGPVGWRDRWWVQAGGASADRLVFEGPLVVYATASDVYSQCPGGGRGAGGRGGVGGVDVGGLYERVWERGRERERERGEARRGGRPGGLKEGRDRHEVVVS